MGRKRAKWVDEGNHYLTTTGKFLSPPVTEMLSDPETSKMGRPGNGERERERDSERARW